MKRSLDARDMYELAYLGAKRAGISVPAKFTDFVDAAEVSAAAANPETTEEPADTVDPTQSAVSTADSSS